MQKIWPEAPSPDLDQAANDPAPEVEPEAPPELPQAATPPGGNEHRKPPPTSNNEDDDYVPFFLTRGRWLRYIGLGKGTTLELEWTGEKLVITPHLPAGLPHPAHAHQARARGALHHGGGLRPPPRAEGVYAMSMKKRAYMRFKVEDDLRCRFKGAATRAHYYPAEALRLFMERFVELEFDPHAVDLTCWSDAVDRAANQVRKEMPPVEPAFGEEDEVQRARREGWAGCRFGLE